MREFQQKRRQRKLLYSRLSVGILIVLLIFAVHAVWGVYGKEKQSAILKDQSTERLAGLQTQQTQLAANNAQLSTQSGVDRQIREDFHMAQPGEQLAVIVGVPATSTTAQASASSGGFFSRMWQGIKSFF